jgi:hypothetical protein
VTRPVRRLLLAVALVSIVSSVSGMRLASAQTPAPASTESPASRNARLAALMGIITARVLQDVDQPKQLATADEQRAVGNLLQFYGNVKRDAGSQARIAQLRVMLQGDEHFDHDAAGTSLSAMMTDVANDLPPDVKAAYIGGVFTAQTFYNAVVLKQRRYDLQYRKFLAADSALDVIAPEIAGLRNDLTNLPDDADWQTISEKAHVLLNAILEASVNAPVQPPG